MSANTAELFSQLVEERRCVRGFEDRAVPEEVMHAVFRDAQRAPSNCNTQPWKVAVASGALKQQVCAELAEGMMTGNIDMDFPYDGSYQGVYKERQQDSARQLLEVAQGIDRADKAARNEAFMRNFEAFGAPSVAFLFLPEPFGIREAADLGMYAQTLMLAITANGMGSCPQTALSFNCAAVRKAFDLPETDRLMFGIAFGYEDAAHPANSCRIGRADIGDEVIFRH